MNGFLKRRNGHGSSILIILAFILLDCSHLSKANNLRTGISYRIRSGLDGSVLTSHYPTFAQNYTLKLGQVTTEEKGGSDSQLWTLTQIQNKSEGSSSGVFWMKPKAGVLNELTGVPKEKEVLFEIREITPNSGTFVVKNVETNTCLQSRGSGQPVVFEKCQELRVAQQWDFEDPNEPNLRKTIAKILCQNILCFRLP